MDKGSSIRGLGKQELKAQFIELGARGGSDGLYPVVREGPGPAVEVPAAVVRVFQAPYPKEEVRTSA